MFNWLNFGQPWYLIGVLAAGIPIVLHLLHRVRAPEMLFSTLRFLRISMEKTARRRRIHNWLLLALRALLFGLLAAAVAQPIFKSSNLRFGGQDLAAVIVVDNSLSMGVRGEKTTRFDRAKVAVNQLLTEDPRPAKQALLFTNGREALEKPEWQVNRREAVARLTAGRVGIGRAGLVGTLTQAAKLLEEVKVPNRALYLVTDLQHVTMRELGQVKALAELTDVPLMIINTARHKPDNVAVTELKVGQEGRVMGSPVRIEAKVENTGATAEEVGVGIAIDGGVLAALAQTVRLEQAGKPGSSTWVNFDCTFNEPGWHGGQVFLMKPKPNIRSLAATDLAAFENSGDLWSDSLAGDDRRYFTIWAVRQIRATVVGPDGGQRGPRAADFYLQMALGVRSASIRTRSVEMSAFAAEPIKDTDVIVWCDVPAPSPVVVRQIEAFVRQGGTLAVFLGPNYLPEDYNQALGSLLPGRLGEALGRADQRGRGRRLQWVAMEHPLFAHLYEKMSAYQTVLVWRYARVVLDPAAKPQVLARLDNDDPLLVSRNVGAGRVYLFTTTANTVWSDLPTTPVFLPVMIRMCLQSGGAGPQAESVGENAAVKLLLRAASPQTVEITPPGRGAAAPVRLTSKIDAGGNVAVFRDTANPGIYTWQTIGPDPQRGAFVVNPSSEESNLDAVDQNLLLAESPLPRSTFVANDNEELAKLVEQQRRGSPLWDYVLFVVLLFAVLECLLANRSRPAEHLPQPTPAGETASAGPQSTA